MSTTEEENDASSSTMVFSPAADMMRACELKRKLTQTRQNGMTVSAYFKELKALWDEIASLTDHSPTSTCTTCTQDQLFQFLNGLDQCFGTVRTRILTTTPTPSLTDAYTLLLAEEAYNLLLAEEDKQQSSQSMTSLDEKEKFAILESIAEEFTGEDDLKRLLQTERQPICYDGFEPSGRMHIAQGVLKAINVNKMTSAGCKVKIWIADLFAMLNKKMDGDMKKIRVVGEYLIEVWKALGMNVEGGQVEFLWASDEINARPEEYWGLVLDIATKSTLARIQKCCQIMGRSESEKLSAAQIIYPCMQCADVFFLKADICQLGMDQRKVNMLARDYCGVIKEKNKPIILSHHMLPGLTGQAKMSKSDTSSSIFMEDEEDQVVKKISKSMCPEKVVDQNPCMEYIKHLIFPWFNEFTVERDPKHGHGGDKTYKSFEELAADFVSGELHPGDLKPALSKAINRILQPVRDHFKNDPHARDLLEKVKGYRVTK